MKENFIYWLKGNLYTGFTGIIVVFFSFFPYVIVHDSYLDYDIVHRIDPYIMIYLFLTALLVIPFLAVLIMKIIKRDMPFYYYGTVGLAYLFILLMFYEIYQSLFYVTSIDIDEVFFAFILYILPVIISSLSGGCIINILRNYKKVYLFYK
jgi:hypothetical protein